MEGITHYLDIIKALKVMVENNGSDLFLTVDTPPYVKIEGIMHALGEQKLTSDLVQDIAYHLMTEDQIPVFEKELELNFGLTALGSERFRINVFHQRGEISMVIRYIKGTVPTIEELNVPKELSEIVMHKQGIVLVVGGTGSGKSTTLAAMIDHRNQNKPGHILTIEDPIEYTHPYKRSVVNQREVGVDTFSYATALKSALREAPDMILVGEIRDTDTMEQVLRFAKSGHLVMSTLHANNSAQTLDRVVGFFPNEAREQILLDLSLSLVAIVCQRLVIGTDGKRVAAVEILQPTPYIRELISQGESDEVMKAMRDAKEPGIQTFDQALYALFEEGKIDQQQALANVDPNSDLALKIRLSGSGSSGKSEEEEGFFDFDF